jgi:hypothetical protein
VSATSQKFLSRSSGKTFSVEWRREVGKGGDSVEYREGGPFVIGRTPAQPQFYIRARRMEEVWLDLIDLN